MPSSNAAESFLETHNAFDIIQTNHPKEWEDIQKTINNFTLYSNRITEQGGSKSSIAIDLQESFTHKGWVQEYQPYPYTHKIDCFKSKIALEIEWNNKDTFFDRDLNLFRHLYENGIITVGVIITRTKGLQRLFNELGKGASYGASTTHFDKLKPKMIDMNSGGDCPVLGIGIGVESYQIGDKVGCAGVLW